mmetsp:Transcript_106558/g.206387  ORF Transcript_106558/g.206387 Transcript_106558/m.206387 type:complete len:315 (+) Transcript_106558:69-1013(+)
MAQIQVRGRQRNAVLFPLAACALAVMTLTYVSQAIGFVAGVTISCQHLAMHGGTAGHKLRSLVEMSATSTEPDETAVAAVNVSADVASNPQSAEAASPIETEGDVRLRDAKAAVLDLITDASVAREVLKPEGKPTRGRVDETILRLEQLNPTTEPAYSELIDGAWRVEYSGTYAPGVFSSPTRELALLLYAGGFSLGNALSSFANGFWGQSLGLQLGPKKVQISDGRDVTANVEVEVSGQKQSLSYKADLFPLSSVRLSEEVLSVDLPEPLGKQEPPLELRRTVLVTFLDKDMMVVRDESGVPEVLIRDEFSGP